jgi:hypothetical protein
MIIVILVQRVSLTKRNVCSYPADVENALYKWRTAKNRWASKLRVRRRVENPSP